MAKPNPAPAFSMPADGFQSMVAMSNAFVENVVQAQRAQLETLMAWQKSLLSLNQELLDEWACHFGGGVPIDG